MGSKEFKQFDPIAAAFVSGVSRYGWYDPFLHINKIAFRSGTATSSRVLFHPSDIPADACPRIEEAADLFDGMCQLRGLDPVCSLHFGVGTLGRYGLTILQQGHTYLVVAH